MDYREQYFELFRIQANTIDALQEITDKLLEITDKIKITHLAAEEMFLNGEDTDLEQNS